MLFFDSGLEVSSVTTVLPIAYAVAISSRSAEA
jgi:hypothetical protein